MSSSARAARTFHVLSATAALLIAALVVGCIGKAPPTSGPSGAAATPSGSSGPTPTSVLIDAFTDAWLVTGRPGNVDLEVIQARTREHFVDLPSGIPDETWSRMVTTSRVGSTTVVRDLAIPELEGATQTLEGAWRLPTIGADPTPVGVSGDGRTIVLVEEGAETGYGTATTSRFAIVHRTAEPRPRIVELQGAFEYDTLSPDGSILYVVEHLDGPPDGHYQVRAVVVDKAGSDEAMAGTPIAQVRRPDGMVFTLYHGAEHPFIHALSSVDAWALCIDLPAIGGNDPASASDWGLAATVDGRSLLAANATVGVVVEMPFADLGVQRSATFAPSASRAISLAKFGHQAGGTVGRRVVASPDGSSIYAAGPGGIVRLGTGELTVAGRFLEGEAVDTLAVMPDGRVLFVLLHAGGRIVKLDAATGRTIGEVPGGGFDRLVAVVPW
jgi:hypothetical protein